ncbi:MAG: hypothetical protein HC789_02880 [Microcoleus sp. CSU_2_2]|nr:hypothetical protein [Microcoleus sp. SU_5_3]NJS09388.1 hypothetical protein [Microcoleus sp. CSU_2_2]
MDNLLYKISNRSIALAATMECEDLQAPIKETGFLRKCWLGGFNPGEKPGFWTLAQVLNI